MDNTLKISAKRLGELAMPIFCPRCFWIKLKVNNKLPFQIFPGIFSSIDSYTKNIVHNWFDSNNCSPPWLTQIGNIIDYKNSPHHSKFYIYDDKTDIILNGQVDDIFLLSDDSYAIIDYKTARYTGTQDKLHPIYEIQLNGYALIGENCGFEPISKLALVYMEPVKLEDIEHENKHHRNDGFNMVFSAKVVDIDYNPNMIKPLLKKTRKIYDKNSPPKGVTGCEDCQKLEYLLDFLI